MIHTIKHSGATFELVTNDWTPTPVVQWFYDALCDTYPEGSGTDATVRYLAENAAQTADCLGIECGEILCKGILRAYCDGHSDGYNEGAAEEAMAYYNNY